jgi:hypothetical protein
MDSITKLNTTEAAILLTATDQNVKGHSVPAVGVLQIRFVTGVGFHETTAKRAYEIPSIRSLVSPEDNWLHAERELLGM